MRPPEQATGRAMMQIKKILCPTDFSDSANRAIAKAVELARQNQAELVLVNVIEEGGMPTREVVHHKSFPNLADEIRKGAKRSLDETVKEFVGDDVNVTTDILQGVPSVEIAEAARRHGADLIVIATHGYGAVKRFLLGSTTERLMRIAPCSVLVVRKGD